MDNLDEAHHLERKFVNSFLEIEDIEFFHGFSNQFLIERSKTSSESFRFEKLDN